MNRLAKIVSLAAFLLLLGGIVAVFALLRQPLGPSLALDVPPEVEAAQPAAVQPAGGCDSMYRRVAGPPGSPAAGTMGR